MQTCTGLGWAVTAGSNPALTGRTSGWAPATSPWGCRLPGDGPCSPVSPVPRCQAAVPVPAGIPALPAAPIAHGSLLALANIDEWEWAGAGLGLGWGWRWGWGWGLVAALTPQPRSVTAPDLAPAPAPHRPLLPTPRSRVRFPGGPFTPQSGSVLPVGPSQLGISRDSVPAESCVCPRHPAPHMQDVVLRAAMSPQQGHSDAGLQWGTNLWEPGLTRISVSFPC